MSELPRDATLLIIDVQQGFADAYWGKRNNPDAEKNLGRLLEAWRASGRPVIHVKHNSVLPKSPLRPGQPGNEIHPLVRPRDGEPLLEKSVNSAFIGTDLETRLKPGTTVIMGGLTTNHCVSTSARMSANLGFKTWVVSDATATFEMKGMDGKLIPAETLHQIGLAELNEEFATIADTESVLRLL